MMKFFRKYNKHLLAVFMTLLMVVFIGGSALQSMLTPTGNRTVAQSTFGPITENDQRRATSTTDILERMGYNWRRPYGGAGDLETIDWILLTREAGELGFGESLASLRVSEDPVQTERVARRLRIKPDQVLSAQAELLSVTRIASLVGTAVSPSEADVRTSLYSSMERVKINAVVLPASAFVEEDATFTDEQIRTHFEKYREREAQAGLEFGYYVQPAIKVQYLRIDREEIAKTVRVANLDRRARAYYDENLGRDPAFLRPADENPVDPTAADGPQPERKPFLDWEEAKASAISAVRKEASKEMTARIADWFVPYVNEAWLAVPRGDNGYKKAPADVATLGYFDKVLERLPGPISYPKGISVGATDFFSIAEADNVPELGATQYMPEAMGRFRLDTLGTLAMRNEFLIQEVPNDRGTNASDYLAAFQTCRYPLKDIDGNIFLFRVVDFREGHIPESLDEVREKVLADLSTLTGLENARWRAEALRGCEDSSNLKEAFESDEELSAMQSPDLVTVVGYVDVAPFARTTPYNAARGAPEPMIRVSGGLGSFSREVVEECFALATAEEKIKVIELTDRAAVMVAEWVETTPAMLEEFETSRASFLGQMNQYRSLDVINEWLKPDNIRARNGFRIDSK